MKKLTQTLIKDIQEWFVVNNRNYAVVGFSGGIDSAVTAALCKKAGIDTRIVSVYIKGHKLSSPIYPETFAEKFKMDCTVFKDVPEFPDLNLGKEAALPIIRNAYLYGTVADFTLFGKRGIVVGTANFDEAGYLGFWGKASDGAQDFYPISHLHKSQIYKIAEELNIPQEIIKAVPSGDLQYSGEQNDEKMIGANYNDIEAIANLAINETIDDVLTRILKVNDPIKFCNNVVKNKFKYKLPFPNAHLYKKLENFRKRSYQKVLNSCETILQNEEIINIIKNN